MADVDYGNKRYPAYVKMQPNWTLLAEEDDSHKIMAVSTINAMATPCNAVYIDPAAGLYKIMRDDGCAFISINAVSIAVDNKVKTNEKSTSSYE